MLFSVCIYILISSCAYKLLFYAFDKVMLRRIANFLLLTPAICATCMNAWIIRATFYVDSYESVSTFALREISDLSDLVCERMDLRRTKTTLNALLEGMFPRYVRLSFLVWK
jgi:hypothetical protein